MKYKFSIFQKCSSQHLHFDPSNRIGVRVEQISVLTLKVEWVAPDNSSSTKPDQVMISETSPFLLHAFNASFSWRLHKDVDWEELW